MATKAEIKELVKNLKKYSTAYYNDNPLISDDKYDELQEQLEEWDPTNPFLESVGASPIKGTKMTHKEPMLSTAKSKNDKQLKAWVDRVLKEAKEVGVSSPTFRVTPKLDGMAGKYIGGVLVTRGNGRKGTVVTQIFDMGVKRLGGKGNSVGEIVMSKSYFDENLQGVMSHPRNVVTGCVNADTPTKYVKQALKAGKVHYVPYSSLPNWTGSGKDLLKKIREITADLASRVDYPLDGMVAEITETKVKTHMGATNHHHRWQIAIKTKGESKETKIGEIGWQTGRTGVITPVLRLDPPVKVEGAVISNVTAHNAKTVKDLKLGKGAKVSIIRSGGVIPKLDKVITPAKKVVIPDACPECGSKTAWVTSDGGQVAIQCTNTKDCPAQTRTTLFYFFKTIETAKGFGPKTLEVLVENDHNSVEAIFALKEKDFVEMGFGDKQAENLEKALRDAINTEIEDSRFLASFGINHLGIGTARKLLSHHPFNTLNTITAKELDKIDGFGTKTSVEIVEHLSLKWPAIQEMLNLGFTLSKTALESEKAKIDSPIAGKKIVFTGKMKQNRKGMQEGARELGATVLSGVSSKLEILVIGEEASQKKIDKANAAGAKVLTEAEYMDLISK